MVGKNSQHTLLLQSVPVSVKATGSRIFWRSEPEDDGPHSGCESAHGIVARNNKRKVVHKYRDKEGVAFTCQDDFMKSMEGKLTLWAGWSQRTIGAFDWTAKRPKHLDWYCQEEMFHLRCVSPCPSHAEKEMFASLYVFSGECVDVFNLRNIWSQCGNFGNVPNKECDEHWPRCVDIRSDVLTEYKQKLNVSTATDDCCRRHVNLCQPFGGVAMIWDLCNLSCFLLLCSLLRGHPHEGFELDFWKRNMFILSLLDLTNHCCHDILRVFTCPFSEKMQRHGDDRSGS